MGLKELRLKRGMTQRELAQRSGVHHVEIAQIETGKRNVRAVSLDTALRLCDAFALLIHVSCLILIPRLRRIECNPPGLDVSL